MTDVYLNADHDIDLESQNMRLTSDINGESIAQRLKITLWMFKGEYFFNEDFGVPYFQTIFVKGISREEIDTVFKSIILNVPGVIELLEYSSEFDRSTRAFSLKFKVRAESGPVIVEVTV